MAQTQGDGATQHKAMAQLKHKVMMMMQHNNTYKVMAMVQLKHEVMMMMQHNNTHPR